MKNIKIKSLIFLAAFAIVAVLTACPAADSGGTDNGGSSKGDSVPGPTFQSLGINIADKKIIVFFSTDISGKPDASRITVKKGPITLKPTTNYTLAIEQGKLVIKLTVAPKKDDKYTVELQGGAVKGAKGKASTANTESKNKTLTVGIIPAISGSLAFQANSNTVLTLAFNTNIEIVDKSKIKMEVKTGGTGKFTDTPATSVVNAKTLLELTLSTPAKADNVYRVKVGAGALRTTVSKLTNIRELTSELATYSTSPTPSLDRHNLPYILNNKLVATFNFPIAIKDREKVKVYKNPARDSDGKEVPLEQNSIAVNNVNKRLLEITLPEDVVEDEAYRLKLDAGAVNKEDKKTNVNKAISPKDLDIRIKAAPVLAERMPFFGRQKIIVTFDGPISILEPNKIKYQLDSATITPTTTPTVENNNQLEIPLNDALADGQVYRIHLEAGALGGDKNQPSTGNIQPENKDITAVVPTLTNVQPDFDSTTQLSVTFPVDVAIVGDGSTIKVQKKDDKDDPETDIDESSFRTVSSRDIAVDDMETKKINIILTGSEEVTP